MATTTQQPSVAASAAELAAIAATNQWYNTQFLDSVMDTVGKLEQLGDVVYHINDCPSEFSSTFGSNVLRIAFPLQPFRANPAAMPAGWKPFLGHVDSCPTRVPDLLAILTRLDHPDLSKGCSNLRDIVCRCHPIVAKSISYLIATDPGLVSQLKDTMSTVRDISQELRPAVSEALGAVTHAAESTAERLAESAGIATKTMNTVREVFEKLKDYLNKLSSGVEAAFSWSYDNIVKLLSSPCELIKVIWEWLQTKCKNWVPMLGKLLQCKEFYGLLGIVLAGVVCFVLVAGVVPPLIVRCLVGLAAAADIAYVGLDAFPKLAEIFTACPQDRFQSLATTVFEIVKSLYGPARDILASAGINSIWQFFLGVVRAKDGFIWTWTACLDFVKGFINTLSTALGLKDLIYFYSVSPQLEKWLEEAHTYISSSVQTRVNASDLIKLRTLHMQGSELAGPSGCRLPDALRRPFQEALHELRRIIGAARPEGAFHKQQPFLGVFAGAPGVGKTISWLHILIAALMRPGCFSQEIRELWKKDPNAVLYAFNNEIRYETGMKEQIIGFVDEWLAVLKPESPAGEWLRILRMCNELISKSEQAAVEDKGAVNKMELICVTTNARCFDSSAALIDGGAPVRRIDLLVEILPNVQAGYRYNSEFGRLERVDDESRVHTIEPMGDYMAFNPNSVVFGVAKGDFSLNGKKHKIALGQNRCLPTSPNDYTLFLTFDQVVDVIQRGIMTNREKYLKADHDLILTTETAQQLYESPVIPSDVPASTLAVFDTERAALMDKLWLALKLEGPNVLQLLSPHQQYQLWSMSFAPGVQLETAREFHKLHLAAEKGLASEAVQGARNYLSKKYHALVLAFVAFKNKALGFLRDYGWLAGLAIGLGALSVGVYLAWDYIKAVVPNTVLNMFSSPEPQSGSYLGSVGDNNPIRQAAKAKFQTRDQGQEDVADAIRLNAWMLVHRDKKDGQAHPDVFMTTYALRARQFIVGLHTLESWKAQGLHQRECMGLFARPQEMSKTVEVRMDLLIATAKPVEGCTELYWIWMPKEMPAQRDITKFLFPSAALAQWVGPEFTYSCAPWRQGKNNEIVKHHFSGRGLKTQKLTIKGRDISAFSYHMPTAIGDCMTPVLVTNPRCPTYRILGFHIAGSDTMGFAEYVSMEAARAVPFDLTQNLISSVEHVRPQSHLTRDVSGTLRPVYVLDDTEPRINRRHEIVPSEFQRVSSSIRGTPAFYGTPDPYRAQNTKLERARPSGDGSLLSSCVESYFTRVLGPLPQVVTPVSLLTQEQVLKGDPSLHMSALGKDHYAGYMWREGFHGTPEEEAYVKKHASRYPYLGREGTRPLEPKMLYALTEAVARDYAAADGGVALCEPIKRDMKSELRTEKPESSRCHPQIDPLSCTLIPHASREFKSARFIAAFGLPHQYRVKQLFGTFVAQFLSTRLWAFHTLGINVAGTEADTLARMLEPFRLIEGDLQECDLSLFLSLAEQVACWIEETHYRKAADWCEEHAKRRLACIIEIFYSLYLAITEDGWCALSTYCNGTGSGLTAVLTTLMCICLFMYTSARILQRRNLPIVDFLNVPTKYLRAVFNGDDCLLGFTALFPLFPAPEIALGFAEWGCVFVNPHTKTPDGLCFQHITEVTFLKRRFLKHPLSLRYVMAQDLSVIHDLPLWVLRSGPPTEEQLRTRTELALLEASAHTEEVYRSICAYVKRLWSSVDQHYVCPTYAVAFSARSRLTDLVGVKVEEQAIDIEFQSGNAPDTAFKDVATLSLPHPVAYNARNVALAACSDVAEALSLRCEETEQGCRLIDPSGSSFDVVFQSTVEHKQAELSNAVVTQNTPTSATMVSAGTSQVIVNPTSSVFRVMQTPILIAGGNLVNTVSLGRYVSYDPFQALISNCQELSNLLEQFRSFSGVVRLTWTFPSNYRNAGRVALRVDPRPAYQARVQSTMNTMWRYGAAGTSRLPGVYAYLAKTNSLSVDVPFLSANEFYQLNGDKCSSNGPTVHLCVEGSFNCGLTQTTPYTVYCTLVDIKFGPVCPGENSTPAAIPFVDGTNARFQSSTVLPKGVIADTRAAVNTVADAVQSVTTDVPSLVGAGLDIAEKTGRLLTHPISTALGAFSDIAGALGFCHDQPKLFYSEAAGAVGQYNSNGEMFYQDLHVTKGYAVKPDHDSNVSETSIAVLGSKYNVFDLLNFFVKTPGITPTGTVLRSVTVHPQASDEQLTAGSPAFSYYPSPSGACFASSKFGRWGCERIRLRLGNCGPQLVAATLRIAMYTSTRNLASMPLTYNYKLSEAVPHADWDLSVTRELELIFDVPMDIPMVPITFALGQIDVICLNPLPSYAGDITQIPISVEVAFEGLRVGCLRDGDVIPFCSALSTVGVSSSAVSFQADNATLGKAIVDLSAGKPIPAVFAAKSMELTLDLLSVAKVAHRVYTLPTSGTNYVIINPLALDCAYTSSSTLTSSGSFLQTLLLAFAFWQGDWLFATECPRATVLGSIGSMQVFDPFAYATVFTVSALNFAALQAPFGKQNPRQALASQVNQAVKFPMDSTTTWIPSMPSIGTATGQVPIDGDMAGNLLLITPPTATPGTYLWPSYAKYLTMQAGDLHLRYYCGAPPIIIGGTTLAPAIGSQKVRRIRGAPSLDDERPLSTASDEQRSGVNHAPLPLRGAPGSGRNV